MPIFSKWMMNDFEKYFFLLVVLWRMIPNDIKRPRIRFFFLCSYVVLVKFFDVAFKIGCEYKEELAYLFFFLENIFKQLGKIQGAH